MGHSDECLALLEKLKIEFPLPSTHKLHVLFADSVTFQLRRSQVHGVHSFWGIGSQIKIAAGSERTLNEALITTAHEYWHAYQALVLRLKPNKRFDSTYERSAREFSAKYVEDYMATRCITSVGISNPLII